MVLEMEIVPKLLHSHLPVPIPVSLHFIPFHLPNQVIEPFVEIANSFPKDYSSLTLPYYLYSKLLLPNQILKFPFHSFPHTLKILPNYNPTSYTQYVIRISPLILSLSFVNRFVNKSILLRLKPLTEPIRAIYPTPNILLKNTTNIM